MKLGEMLVEAGLATEAQIEDAMSHDERRLGSALIAAGVVAPAVVARTLAQQHGLPAIDPAILEGRPAAVASLLPELVARRHCALALAVRGAGGSRVLTVAMRDPSDLVALDELAFAAGMKIEPRVAPELLLRAALDAPTVGAPVAAAPIARTPESGRAPITVPPSSRAPITTPASGRVPITAPPSGLAPITVPPSGRAPITPAPAPGNVPLTYLPAGTPFADAPTGASRMVASLIKFGAPLLLIVGVIYFATAYKKCISGTSRAVGTHHDARALHLAIDFPDAGWRIAPGAGKKVHAQAEYFYRGGIPELPHVGMFVLRGAPGEIADAAQTLAGEVVQDVRTLECKPSYARAGAFMCRGYGAVGLFGKRMQNAEIEVHTWRGTTDTIEVVMIKPDHTLSETEFILASITEI